MSLRSGACGSRSINDQGVIVGFSYVPFDRPHLGVVVWNSERALEHASDTIDGVAFAVNDTGVRR
jgi:hypothetical protein